MVPFMILDFSTPSVAYGYKVGALGVVLWSVFAILGMKATQLVEVSVKEPLMQIQLLFMLLFASVFLNESLTVYKIGGTISIFLGTLILTYRKNLVKDFMKPGIKIIIVSALIGAVIGVVDKIALEYWSVPVYSFLAFLAPGMVLTPWASRRFDKFSVMLKDKFWPIIASSMLIVMGAYFGFTAYKMTEMSNAVPIFRLSTLVSVFGGIILLNEKDHLFRKIIGAILMIIGVVLIYVF
jgi:drug/metabolite transporter (DMT)-like permease